jgi:uncharacterized protein (DUF1810 family)
MSSSVDSGINTYVGNFAKLIDKCESFGPVYSPVPGYLHIPMLRHKYGEVEITISEVDDVQARYIVAEGDRKKMFSSLPTLATRIQAAAIVLDLSGSVTVRIKEIVRKIRGKRARKIEPDVEGEEPKKHISVSQVSFNEQIEHLNQLVSLLKSQPGYTPAEEELTIAYLEVLLNNMRAANARFIEAEVLLAAARQRRNHALYATKTGMMDTALAVKEYVKAVFGATSVEYKEVKHINFVNKKI